MAEPIEFDYPEFHEQGMGCGLEDRGITDRYEAMRYGWDEALDRVAEIIDDIGPLYAAPQPAPDVSALVEALECMIIGACAVAVPHNGERAVLQDAVNIARAALAAYHSRGRDND